jgi:hypothetical protein
MFLPDSRKAAWERPPSRAEPSSTCTPRSERAGIARPGLMVTSEGLTMEELALDPKFSLFQGIAHEIGHY